MGRETETGEANRLREREREKENGRGTKKTTERKKNLNEATGIDPANREAA